MQRLTDKNNMLKELKIFRFVPLKLLFPLFIIIFLSNLLFVLFFHLFGYSIDLFISSLKSDSRNFNDFLFFLKLQLIVTFALISTFLLSIVITFLEKRIVFNVYLKLNNHLLTKLSNISIEKFNKLYPSKELFSLLANDAKIYVFTKIEGLIEIWTSLTLIIITFSSFFFSSLLLGLVVIIFITFSQLFTILFTRIIEKKRINLSYDNQVFNNNMGEYLDNIDSLYFYGHEELLIKNTKTASKKQIETKESLNFNSKLVEIVSYHIFGQAIRDIIFFLILFFVIFYPTGTLKIGNAVVVSSIFGSLIPKFQTLFNSIIQINSLKGLVKKIIEKFDNENFDNFLFSNQNFESPKDFKSIKVVDVNPLLPNNKRLWKNGVSFEITKGKRYCFIGPSGVGKTTLINILLGIKKKYFGSVSYNDINYKEIPEFFFRKNFSSYPGKNIIFNDTVSNNVTLWDKGEIKTALIQANLEKEIINDNKIDFDAKNLSDGQKQRVCLARVFFDSKDLICLDEPFANLDKKNVFTLAKNIIADKEKTYLIVSHHLPIKDTFCDVTIKLEDLQIEKVNRNREK